MGLLHSIFAPPEAPLVSDDPANNEFLSTLNDQQREAVTHGTSPLLIIAGRGDGENDHAGSPSRSAGGGRNFRRTAFCLLTFSRRSAADLMRRVSGILSELDPSTLKNPQLVSRAAIKRLQGGTFHSVATALLRRHGTLLGLSPDFTILDRSDSEDLINLARANMELPEGPKGKKNSKKRFPAEGHLRRHLQPLRQHADEARTGAR